MQRNRGPKLFPLIIIVIVVILLIIAIVSIGRAVFGGKDTASTVVVDPGRTTLLETGSSHSVSLTVRGPITADESFKSYTIEVSPLMRSMNAYKGYVESVEAAKNYDNNQKAYEEFVFALDKANMMKGKQLSGDKNDLRGVCATGYVYEYAVLTNGQEIKSLWTSTCGGSKGSLDASVGQLNNLFQGQIPDFSTLVPFRQSGLPTKL